MSEPVLRPPELPDLTGDQPFDGLDATVPDFWRWALGDLRMNNARGYLAEFLVARAVGSTDPHRIEWGEQDVIAPDGTRIEVKSTGYLQSWSQHKPSRPTFSLTGMKHRWEDASASWVKSTDARVDVWVFALHTVTHHADYRPLDIDQWSFWVATEATVRALGQKQAALSTIERLSGAAVKWPDLRSAVQATATVHRAAKTSSDGA